MAALLGAYFLYQDLYQSGSAGIGKPIAKVEHREARVRRRAAASYVWNNVSENESLFRKDSIQTGKGSAASVRLSNGNLLDINEDSLVVMDDTTQLSVNFLRGSVVVHKADGDSQVSVGKDGKAQVEELSVRLLKPISLEQFFVLGQAQKKIIFSWEPRAKGNRAKEAPPLSLQISTERKFNPEYTQNFVPSGNSLTSVELNLSSGKYFWRVVDQGQAAGKALTEIRQFRLTSVEPLRPLFPAPQQKIAALMESGSNPAGMVPFRWMNPQSMGSNSIDEVGITRGEHHIELAKDPEFKKSVSSVTVNPLNGSARVLVPVSGLTYWRMRSIYGDLSVVSPASSFDLQLSSPVPTPTPTMIPKLPFPAEAHPSSGAVINILTRKDPVVASWSEVKGADQYEVNVYAEGAPGLQNQKKVLVHQVTDQTHLSLKELKVGLYSWTIRSLDRQKNPGEFRPLMNFEITYGELLPAPQVVSPEVQ